MILKLKLKSNITILMLLSINGIIVGIQIAKMNIGKEIITTILLQHPSNTKKCIFISAKMIHWKKEIQNAHLIRRLKNGFNTKICIYRL